MQPDGDLIYADDNPADIELLSAAFEEIGWRGRIVPARDGYEAKAMLSACSVANACPRVILIDLNMPGMSGWDLLHWIDHKSGMSPVRVIYSSSQRPEDVERAHREGATYLVKPSCISEMERVARTVRSLVAKADGGCTPPIPGADN